jgi:3-hydroxybutyryl-CoA dehydratase
VRWTVGFDELEVGEEFETTGRTVAEADVDAFAALTGDQHPQHTDAEWAASSRFGERIAHGMLVLSFAVGLAPLDPDRVLALRRVGEVVFKRPVLLGDTINVRGSVLRLRALSEDTGLVGCRWEIVNQHGELCARAEVEVVWRRDALVAETA